MGYPLFSLRRELRFGRLLRFELRRLDVEERVQSGDEYSVLRDGVPCYRKVKEICVDSIRKNLPRVLRLPIFNI